MIEALSLSTIKIWITFNQSYGYSRQGEAVLTC